MAIKRKSREELQEQAKGFLDYSDRIGKITEKQKNKISKILGLSATKKGFFERLSKKPGNKIEISDKFEIEELLRRKKINFETLWDEYVKYLGKVAKAQNFLNKGKVWKESYRKFNACMLLHDKYPQVEYEEIEDVWYNIASSGSNNLKIIFEKYPNVTFDELKSIGNRLRQIIESFDLNIFLKKNPNLSIYGLDELLKIYKNSKDEKPLKTIFGDIQRMKLYLQAKKLGINYARFCNTGPHALETIMKKFKNITYKDLEPYLGMIFNKDFDDGGIPIGSEPCPIDVIIEHYPNIEISKLNLLYEKLFSSISHIKISGKHLEIIFQQYPEITIDELVSGANGLSQTNPENLQIIFENCHNIKYETLCKRKWIAIRSNPENLKIIFGVLTKKHQIVGFEELSAWGRIAQESNPKNLKIFLDKYPDFNPEKYENGDYKELNSLNKILKNTKPDNLKIIFEKYPEIKIDELNLSKNICVLGYAEPDELKIVIENFWPLDFSEICQFEKIFSFNKKLPTSLNFNEANHKGYLKFLNEILDTNYDSNKKLKMIEKVVTLTFEQAQNYVEVFKMLDDSISMDIKRVKNELIDELLESDDPKNAAKQIINIFERNNLPLTGKIFKVFELLYPKEKFKKTLRSHGSPVLHQYLNEGKSVYNLIYRDLMNIAINSGDRSLRDYLNTFVGSEDLLKKFEEIISSEGFDGNDPLCLQGKFDENDRKKDEEAQAKLLYLFRKMSVLYNRYSGKEINEGSTIENKELEIGESIVADNQLVKFYNDIRKGFRLKSGESIYDRLQRFLWGLGYHSFNEVLKDMNESKKQAHERGLKLYNEAVDNGGKIKFPKGAFLKGIDDNAFSKIINRGVTCREYLGGGDDGNAARSDATPFDIDGLYLDSSKDWDYYGNILLITDTNRCNIVDTRNEGLDGYNESQYELFKTGVVNRKHYGIRTGIPTTEVDYIIFNGSFDRTAKIKIPTDEHQDGEYVKVLSIFQNMCYEIARNGYYIPIVDNRGNVRFTPEMYHQIRAGFNYMQYYDGFDVECVDGKWESKESDNEVHKEYTGTNKEKITDDGLKKLIADNSPNNEIFSGFAKENRELAENTIKWIKKILKEQCGIDFNSKHDTSITGAELHDSGSTGRGTDIPTKDVDLDFTLLLDAKDYDEKLGLIKETIYRETGTGTSPEDRGGGSRTGGFQMKSKKNKIGQSSKRPNGIPLDLLILKKSQVIDYSSSDAMKEKLKFIKDKYGEKDLDRVRTNVIIMKKLLKSQSCYKKSDAEGGIAGIGVENWITQHHGSFIEALESFEKVAFNGEEYKAGSRPIPLEKFQELYPIYDAGENYKDGCNDNFVEKINEHGYNGMLKIVIALRTKGIEGIENLIKKYERDKAKYTK